MPVFDALSSSLLFFQLPLVRPLVPTAIADFHRAPICLSTWPLQPDALIRYFLFFDVAPLLQVISSFPELNSFMDSHRDNILGLSQLQHLPSYSHSCVQTPW